MSPHRWRWTRRAIQVNRPCRRTSCGTSACGAPRARRRGVAAQIGIESKIERLSHLSFKRSSTGAFNVCFIGSTCTTLPWWLLLRLFTGASSPEEKSSESLNGGCWCPWLPPFLCFLLLADASVFAAP